MGSPSADSAFDEPVFGEPGFDNSGFDKSGFDNAGFGGLRVDSTRLLDRLEELAAIGAIDGTRGCSRLALTDDDKAGRDLVTTWMADLGLEITVDGIGNVIGVFGGPAGAPPVMCGSHIDTVRTGGRYDGNLGVLAGLEVIETVQAAEVPLQRPLAVGFFTDEEGSRFHPTCSAVSCS